MGLDYSNTMINIALKENSTIIFCVDDAKKKPFNQDKIALIYSCLRIHYFQELTSLFAEVARVTRHQGRFIFSCHHPFSEVVDEVWTEHAYQLTMHPYFHNQEYRWKMLDCMELVSYHHTFENIFNALYQNGFLLNV